MAEATTMVHVRVSKKLKDAATKASRDLGVSLSLVAEQAFRDFVANKRLVIEELPTPNKKLALLIKEAEAHKGDASYWKSFDSPEAFLADLQK